MCFSLCFDCVCANSKYQRWHQRNGSLLSKLFSGPTFPLTSIFSFPWHVHVWPFTHLSTLRFKIFLQQFYLKSASSMYMQRNKWYYFLWIIARRNHCSSRFTSQKINILCLSFQNHCQKKAVIAGQCTYHILSDIPQTYALMKKQCCKWNVYHRKPTGGKATIWVFLHKS